MSDTHHTDSSRLAREGSRRCPQRRRERSNRMSSCLFPLADCIPPLLRLRGWGQPRLPSEPFASTYFASHEGSSGRFLHSNRRYNGPRSRCIRSSGARYLLETCARPGQHPQARLQRVSRRAVLRHGVHHLAARRRDPRRDIRAACRLGVPLDDARAKTG
jgi:hypothetical protein